MNKKLNLLATVLTVFVLAGCNTEACKDTDCGTEGTCQDILGTAVCVCNTGYEQNVDGKCETRVTAKFVGTWKMTENITDLVTNAVTPNYQYNITITESAQDISRLIMDGFGDVVCANNNKAVVNATAADDKFVVDAGPYCPDGTFTGYTFANTDATIAGTTITGKYDVSWVDNGTTYSYRVTYSAVKQ